jgi:nitrogen fixation protein NifU and related proteins
MSDLSDLYQEVILDHGRNPRNFRTMADATATAEGLNPLCGDHYHVFLRMDGDRVADVSFQGSGCAISKASASLMSQVLKGKSAADAEDLFRRFHRMVVDGDATQADGLGKLAVLKGVADFPTRVKCASLAWHALHAALHGEQKPATTE